MLNEVDGIPVYGEPVDEGALLQIKNCAAEAEHVALMGGSPQGLQHAHRWCRRLPG
jgi:hypothetical protein